jgi:hypothetical protein
MAPWANVERLLEDLSRALEARASEVDRRLSELAKRLGQVPRRSLPSEFETGTSLKASAALELDDYMHVCHVEAEAPQAILIESVVEACRGFHAVAALSPVEAIELERLALGFRGLHGVLARAFGVESRTPLVQLPLPGAPRELADEHLLEVWRRGHWIFFVLTQGLTLTLLRFADALRGGDVSRADLELRAATELLWASGASMKLAGSFTDAQYHAHVRPTMTHGDPQAQVKRSSLSGTMTWDHHFLVSRVWREHTMPFMDSLPVELAPSHAAFTAAYRDGLASGHRVVCSKFGGDVMGSLVAPNQIAVEILDSIATRRLTQLGARHR